MKIISVIALSILVLTIGVKDLALYALFKINQQHISDNICIKRYQSDNNCQGICFFTKLMAEQEDATNSPKPSEEEERTINLFIDADLKPKMVSFYDNRHLIVSQLKSDYLSFVPDIFHPPRR